MRRADPPRPLAERDLRHRHLTHRFVPVIPDRLEPGVLYLALEYGTATHSCCCGCGEEVVTPLTPTDWRITYDGESISLWPSVGNWNAACRSHYIVDGGKVIACGDWTDEQVAAERRRDRAEKSRYYRTLAQGAAEPVSVSPAVSSAPPPFVASPSGPLGAPAPRPWWRAVWDWLAARWLR